MNSRVPASLEVATADDAAGLRRPDRPRRRTVAPYVLIAPALTLVVVTMLYPVAHGVWLSLTDTNAFTGEITFVGFGHYLDLFGQPQFRNALRQSFILVAGTVALGISVALAFAIVLDRIPWGGRIWRTIALVPWLISGVAVATIWRAMFSPTGGLADTVTAFLGLPRVIWFGSGASAMFVIILISVWMISPFSTLILYAGLKTVDPDLYEAAAIDGAGFWSQLRYIALPSISPQFALALIFLSFAAFNSFDIILLATGGGPGRSTEVLALLLYRLGFEQLDFHAAAACMVVLLTINVALSLVYLKVFPDRSEA